ncbi:hypothetical protein HDU80_010994 [Chytriomyces hyalinus]|nr:hypothetical protein HDU80_010994 [Chytriomyces hyalinus]
MDYDYSLNAYHPALYDLHAINPHANFPINMTLDQILLAGPMLLETEQHCDMEVFGNIPFAPTPSLSALQTTLDHYDLFAAAAAQESTHHQQLYNLTHDEYQQHQQQQHHHYEHHAAFSQHQLMSPLFDSASSHDSITTSSITSTSITPPLSHSPPPSPPVFLPMSIVAGYNKSASLLSPSHGGKTENLTRCLIKTEAPGASPTLTPRSTHFDLDVFDTPLPSSTKTPVTIPTTTATTTTTTTTTRKRSTKNFSRSKNTHTQHSSSSCSDDNDSHMRRVGGTSKKRHTLGEDQADILKSCFEENRFLQPNQASELAATLGMSETQVKIWFQNRRAYGKRKGYRRKSRSAASRSQHNDDDDDEEEEDDWE